MQVKIIDGKHLNKKEKEAKVLELNKKDSFNNLVEEMQKSRKFETSDLVPKMVYQFSAIVQEPDSQSTFNATIMHLTDDEENVNIIYKELPKELGMLYGDVIIKNSSNAVKHIVNMKNEVEVQEVQAKELDKKDNEEDLPNNPEYNKEDPINKEDSNTLAFNPLDDCVPGGYQHCGRKCGKHSNKGGDGVLNETDSCCSTHDDCYHYNRKSIACCDRDLINCVAGHTTIAATAIRYTFGAQALACQVAGG